MVGAIHSISQKLQRLWVIWIQCYLRIAAGPCLPNGPIMQLSPYLTQNPCMVSCNSNSISIPLEQNHPNPTYFLLALLAWQMAIWHLVPSLCRIKHACLFIGPTLFALLHSYISSPPTSCEWVDNNQLITVHIWYSDFGYVDTKSRLWPYFHFKFPQSPITCDQVRVETFKIPNMLV